MSWLSLSDAQVEPHQVRLRFVPEALVSDDQRPVVEVTVEGLEHPDQLEGLVSKLRDSFVIDLEARECELALVTDWDFEETILKGSSVRLQKVAYSVEELLSIAVSLQRTADENGTDAHRQSAKLTDVRRFVVDLIERAEKKRSMSDRPAGAIEAQLSVLNRVLHRLDDA